MIGGLATLLLFQLLGELAVAALHLPIPGPVVGMLLLFLALMLHGNVPHSLASATQGMLNHLALMFVPAGTGVITYLVLIRREWLPITVALIGSTILTIIVTALTQQILSRGQALTRSRKGARE